MRRRAVIGLAMLALAAVAFWLWPRSRSELTSSTGSAAPHDRRVPLGSAAEARRLWLALRGMGERRIAGTVERDGVPVAGANVRLASVASTAGMIAEPKVTTEADGHFDFGSQLAMEYELTAEAPHTTGALLEVNPRLMPSTEDLVLVLHACDASIHGTVRDVSGGVVPKARISRGFGDTLGPGVDAADDGTYELCVEVGSDEVVVAADGYAQLSDRVTAYGPVLRNFELSPEATLTGRVVRADDHTPVPNAIVRVTAYARLAAYGASEHQVASDAEGNFHVEGLSPGAVELEARADRLASPHAVHTVAEVGKSHDPITCVVVPTLTVSGKVVAADDKTPVAGTTVWLGSSGNRYSNLSAVSRADGSFDLDGVLPGVYTPYVNQELVAGRPRRVQVDKDVTGLVVEVERGASVEGRITRGGKPVDGVEVSARPAGPSAESDHGGKFVVRGIKPGKYRLYAESKRTGAFTNGPEVVLAKGEHKKGVDIELDLAASIAGVVVDQNDAPVPGVLVRFSLLRSADFGTATTADDGTFIARALSGGGDYIYAVQANEDSAFQFKPLDGRRFPPIAVKDGNSHVTGLRVRVRVDRLTISGRVLDASGTAVPDVNVTAMAGRRNTESLTKPTTTDGSGAFTLRGLTQGAYTVFASAPTGTERLENVEAGRADVTVRLSALGSLDGTLEGFGPDVEVWAFASTSSPVPSYAHVDGNTFAFPRLPIGTYDVWARSSSGQDISSVTVTAGAPAHVALHQHGFGVIEGSVRDATGAPMPNLQCIASAGADSRSDDTGAVRFEDVPAGAARISCWGPGGNADADVTVVSGQTAHVDLVVQPRKRTHGYAGMRLEDNLGEIAVAAVVPGGPADKAGIVAGDIIDKVDGAAEPADLERMVYSAPIGTTIKITLTRGDKQLTVTVTTEAPPP